MRALLAALLLLFPIASFAGDHAHSPPVYHEELIVQFGHAGADTAQINR